MGENREIRSIKDPKPISDLLPRFYDKKVKKGGKEMKKTKMVAYYCGKRITELSRKELIECIEEMGRQMRRDKEERDLMGDDYYKLLTEKKLGLD